jgi:hypothetical protein
MRRGLSRRAALLAPALLPALLAACGGGGTAQTPPEAFEQPSYDYLTPLRLNVASIEVEDRFVPAGRGAALAARDPLPPSVALTRMARDRLQALGASGRAVFVIKDASLLRTSGGYSGSFAVELDIYTSTNTPAAFAEARVSRAVTTDSDDEPRVLYDMTRQLMDAMNVEFEYQIRRTLKEWLAPAPGAPPSPVEQQALPPPS